MATAPMAIPTMAPVLSLEDDDEEDEEEEDEGLELLPNPASPVGEVPPAVVFEAVAEPAVLCEETLPVAAPIWLTDEAKFDVGTAREASPHMPKDKSGGNTPIWPDTQQKYPKCPLYKFQLGSAQIGRDKIWVRHLLASGQQKRSPVSVWQSYSVGQHPVPVEPQLVVPAGHVGEEIAQPP